MTRSCVREALSLHMALPAVRLYGTFPNLHRQLQKAKAAAHNSISSRSRPKVDHSSSSSSRSSVSSSSSSSNRRQNGTASLKWQVAAAAVRLMCRWPQSRRNSTRNVDARTKSPAARYLSLFSALHAPSRPKKMWIVTNRIGFEQIPSKLEPCEK